MPRRCFRTAGSARSLVDGHLSDYDDAFFADRMLAYKPQMTSGKVTLLLRRCEFFSDRVVCLDPRRKLELWLDSNVLAGLVYEETERQNAVLEVE